MNWGGPTFVIALIALSTLGWMFTSWIRAKHGYPIENEWGGTVQRGDIDAARKVELLTTENEKLHGQVSRLEERLAVLERIATDSHGSTARLSDEIEKLR